MEKPEKLGAWYDGKGKRIVSENVVLLPRKVAQQVRDVVNQLVRLPKVKAG